MKKPGKTLTQVALFQCRIYRIFSAVAFYCLYLNVSYCQEIGSYRTIASGNFGNISIWEIFDGSVWIPASVKPTQINDIYIDQLTVLTLTANEEAKSVFINAESGAAQKLNLNDFNLDVYGTLQAFDGPAPGVPSGTNASLDWIGNSISSTLTFKGESRIIIPDGAWSAQSTNSRYSVIFDPGPGIELITQRAFKALKFTIRSGFVNQKINITSTPNACATFSFNNNNSFGTNTFGDFIIENGGALISECNDDLIFRSASLSANLFDLQPGGTLILEGTSPRIEAANFQMYGKVIFRGGSSTKSIPAPTYADAGTISSFHDIEIQGIHNVQFPSNLTITGDLSRTASGQFLTNNSHLTFAGTEDQEILGFAFSPQDLTVNKSDGKVKLDQNLTVLRNLTMLDGKLNFQNNTLIINNSNAGTLNYQGGSWENLTSFTYENVPPTFDATTGTFPFGDRYHGGIRKVQLLGTNAGGNLTINYTEYQGADFNPGFDDTGGIPILYRLFSYFNFSGLNSSLNPLELRISADNLIVDEPEDLRLVCTGYAAPGTHIESSDEVNLWAIRSLTFDDLPDKNFTVGSFRELSILPVTWLSLSANSKNGIKKINWSLTSEKDNEFFEIYRSADPLKDWTKVGEVRSLGDSESPTSYSFIDESYSKHLTTYYQIKVIDFLGQEFKSKVVRLENDLINMNNELSISPNPHFSGKISVSIPESFHSKNSLVLIFSTQGVLVSSFDYTEVEFSENLHLLNPGLYFITFSNSESSIQTRWIKR